MPTLDTPRKDQITVEADTVEAALAEITTKFGEDAEIMRAQKVHRGGVGGFFAKEMVQLTARKRRQSATRSPRQAPASQPPAALRPPAAPPPPAAAAAEGDGIAGVLERMAQDADAGDGDFRTVLQRELATGPVNTGSEGLLAAIGWDTEGTEEDDTPAPANPDEDHEPDRAPTFVDESDEETPKPVAVGPVLDSTPTLSAAADAAEVAPAFPDVASSPPEVAPVFPEVVAPDGDQTQFIEFGSVADNPPVVPFEFPIKPVLNETAEVQPMPQTATEEVVHSEELAEDLDTPAGMGRVDWSTTALLRLGMPAPVIEAVADVDEQDDLDWIDCIAEAVAPHCGALPRDNVIVVGPHAERLAEPLGLPLVHAGEMAPYDGSFCAMVEDTAQDREWLEYVQGGRGIHLVIGDEPWQDLLIGEPVAVSWVGETAVSDALYLAFTLGATLGYGTVDGFVSSMVRAQPTDVALAIRRIVGRR